MKAATREDLFAYAKEQFGAEPEYLWARDPSGAVLRHKDNNKWFAVVMNVGLSSLGLKGAGRVDVLDVKCDPLMVQPLLEEKGVLPAYHMNKQKWISVLLDGETDTDIVIGCLRMSFDLTKSKNGRTRTEPKSWIIPANPKICDLEDEFDENGEIMWTLSARFIKGDTVYIYIGAPESELRYECKVLETDIPFDFGTEMISGKTAVRLKLVRRFGRGELPVSRLRELGVTNIRGPRGLTHSLQTVLDSM